MNEQATKSNAGGAASVKKSILASLSKRDRILIYAMVVIIVSGAIIYFGVIPGADKYRELQGDIATLEQKENDYKNAIAQIDRYKKEFAEAQETYAELRPMFNSPMDPESLDEMITGLLLAANLDPQTLSKQPLGLVEIQPFGSAHLTTGETPEGEDATNPEGNAGDASSVFVYTINVSAKGTVLDLSALLTNVVGKTGVRIASFTYSKASGDVDTIINADSLDAIGDIAATSGDSDAIRMVDQIDVSLVFKVYVMVDGYDYTRPSQSGEGSEGESSGESTENTDDLLGDF
ncbi:MAG: hypothetical protein LBH63_02815 [Clostridiales Family XIII bacterium]|nr:hypothetical protein [Clostridiales Family XIII bacterium]